MATLPAVIGDAVKLANVSTPRMVAAEPLRGLVEKLTSKKAKKIKTELLEMLA